MLRFVRSAARLALHHHEAGVGKIRGVGDRGERHRLTAVGAVSIVAQRAFTLVVDDAVVGIVRCCSDLEGARGQRAGLQLSKDGVFQLENVLLPHL